MGVRCACVTACIHSARYSAAISTPDVLGGWQAENIAGLQLRVVGASAREAASTSTGRRRIAVRPTHARTPMHAQSVCRNVVC
jgi:hypothetical protein